MPSHNKEQLLYSVMLIRVVPAGKLFCQEEKYKHSICTEVLPGCSNVVKNFFFVPPPAPPPSLSVDESTHCELLGNKRCGQHTGLPAASQVGQGLLF